MTDDLRRARDRILASLDKRLALLEQAQDLGRKAAEARDHALERTVETLRAEVRASLDQWQAVTADPIASPAGRAVVADITEVRAKVDEHDDFIQQTQGAIRLAKFAIGTSLLAAIVSFLQIVATIQRSAL